MADEGRVPERGKDRGCVPLACCWDGKAGCLEKWSLGVLEGWGWSSQSGGSEGLLQLDTGHDGKIIVFQAQGDLELSPEPTDFQF